MKPKKKHHFHKNESDDFPIKQKKRLPKQKNLHPKLWMLEEDFDEEIISDKEASIIFITKDWGET